MYLRALLVAFAALLSMTAASGAPTTPWVKVIAATPEGGVRQGNPHAPVKLVEYGSRGCPYCRAFAVEGVAQLRAKYIATGKVSYEYREFWIHPPDPGLSLAGHCVPTGWFFSVLDEMYAKQEALMGRANQQLYETIQKLPRNRQPAAWARQLGYVALITKRGMPLARLNQCLANINVLNKLVAQVQAASAKGVDSTPTFFINGRKADAGTWAELEPELKASGA